MHEYMSKTRQWDLICPGFPEEVARTRRWIRDLLHDTPHTDDAALIVTELASNALRHSTSGNGDGTFRITLIRFPGTVTLSVTDSGGSPTAPHVENPTADATHGRGLSLVTALATHVHIHGDDHHGHTVTAELHLTHMPSTTTPQLPSPGTTTR